MEGVKNFWRIKKKRVTNFVGVKYLGCRTKEEKVFFWKAFERQRLGWYRNFAVKAIKLFEKEAKDISKIYGQIGRQGLEEYFNHKSKKNWEGFLKGFYVECIKAFGQRSYVGVEGGAKSYVGGRKEIKQFDPYDPYILSWSSSVSAKRATLMGEFSKEVANRRITEDIANNMTTDQIARDIRECYTADNAFRAMRMARTETVGASNFGSLQGAKQTQFRGLNKTWVNSGDDRVREEHDFEETVPIDDLFSNGLDYPGDEAGEPEEVINCRCTLAYDMAGEDVEGGVPLDDIEDVGVLTEEIVNNVEEVAVQPSVEEIYLKAGDNIKNQKFESCYLFDKNGNELLFKDGARSSVSFKTPEEIQALRDADVLIHNHPSSSSFSIDDLATANKFSIKEVRAVGEFDSYIVRFPDTPVKYADLDIQWNTQRRIMRDKYYQEYMDLWAKMPKSGQGPKVTAVRAEIDALGRKCSHEAMEITAQKCGLTYWKM